MVQNKVCVSASEKDVYKSQNSISLCKSDLQSQETFGTSKNSNTNPLQTHLQVVSRVSKG